MRRPRRRPLDEAVVEYDGEVVLARDARPQTDPGLVLRVAAASANTGLPIGAGTLKRLAKGRTTIAIAHRLSTIADADRILVLDGGRLAQSGTHEQLLASGGLYAEMWNRQAQEKREPQPAR